MASPLGSIPPIPVPAAAAGMPATPSAIDQVSAAVRAQAARRGKVALPAAAAGSTATPSDIMAALQQILANFAGERGGVSPQALAALRAMLEQRGALSPQMAAMLQQAASQMGAVNA